MVVEDSERLPKAALGFLRIQTTTYLPWWYRTISVWRLYDCKQQQQRSTLSYHTDSVVWQENTHIDATQRLVDTNSQRQVVNTVMEIGMRITVSYRTVYPSLLYLLTPEQLIMCYQLSHLQSCGMTLNYSIHLILNRCFFKSDTMSVLKGISGNEWACFFFNF